MAPALLGGLIVIVNRPDGPRWVRLTLPDSLGVVLIVPNYRVPTGRARAALPDRVSLQDAVANSSRAAMLVAALAQEQYHLLEAATEDFLHQPYRKALNPRARALHKRRARGRGLRSGSERLGADDHRLHAERAEHLRFERDGGRLPRRRTCLRDVRGGSRANRRPDGGAVGAGLKPAPTSRQDRHTVLTPAGASAAGQTGRAARAATR